MTTRRPRVLLADDHPSFLTALERLLAPDCDVVGSVADGAATLEATTRLQPDVVVVDVFMPRLDGLEVCRAITHTNPHVKVILLSGADEPAIRERGLTSGAVAVMTKQEAADLLLATIQKANMGQG